MIKLNYFFFLYCLFLLSCSTPRMVLRKAVEESPLDKAHTGICIYDPAAKKYLYTKDADKYFVPASNMKIFSMYTALSVLGDSMPGLQYAEGKDSLYLLPTGDPSFLHPDFTVQPVFDFLQTTTKPLAMSGATWKDRFFGKGWAWDDYSSSYAPERSPFPVYGNVIRWIQQERKNEQSFSTDSMEALIYSVPDINWKTRFVDVYAPKSAFRVTRDRSSNLFFIKEGRAKDDSMDVPYITDTLRSGLELLQDALGKDISITDTRPVENIHTIYSRPIDSILTPMMHVSDNFFAEQMLLASAYKKTGFFNAADMIDSMLQGPLKDMPGKPRWVDGSGLSRYNLVTPRGMVWLLDKMQAEFGMDRMKRIFATGGTGTLKSYYLKKKGKIFAKTGTLSNQVALSGYLYSKQDKLLLFSVLVNNYNGSASDIRAAVEALLENL